MRLSRHLSSLPLHHLFNSFLFLHTHTLTPSASHAFYEPCRSLVSLLSLLPLPYLSILTWYSYFPWNATYTIPALLIRRSTSHLIIAVPHNHSLLGRLPLYPQHLFFFWHLALGQFALFDHQPPVCAHFWRPLSAGPEFQLRASSRSWPNFLFDFSTLSGPTDPIPSCPVTQAHKNNLGSATGRRHRASHSTHHQALHISGPPPPICVYVHHQMHTLDADSLG